MPKEATLAPDGNARISGSLVILPKIKALLRFIFLVFLMMFIFAHGTARSNSMALPPLFCKANLHTLCCPLRRINPIPSFPLPPCARLMKFGTFRCHLDLSPRAILPRLSHYIVAVYRCPGRSHRHKWESILLQAQLFSLFFPPLLPGKHKLFHFPKSPPMIIRLSLL